MRNYYRPCLTDEETEGLLLRPNVGLVNEPQRSDSRTPVLKLAGRLKTKQHIN